MYASYVSGDLFSFTRFLWCCEGSLRMRNDLTSRSEKWKSVPISITIEVLLVITYGEFPIRQCFTMSKHFTTANDSTNSARGNKHNFFLVHILLIPRINPPALAMYHLANMRFFGWNVDYCWRDVSPNIPFAIWINYSANKTTRGLLSLGIGIQFLLLGRARLSSCESARNIELLGGGERPRSQAHITSKTWRNAFSMKTDVLNPQEITTKISTKLFALKENTFLSFCGFGGCFVGWEDEVATAAA